MPDGMNEGLHWVGHDELKRSWRWFAGLGIALIALGLLAVCWATLTTLVSVEVFGWMLVFGGGLSIAHACWRRRWGGFFLDLFSGVLYLIVGFMVVSTPLAAAYALTLLMALLFLVGGTFRIIVAVSVPMHHWGWLLLNGVVNIILGVLIWRQLSTAAFWIIGLFVGIDLFFYGWTLLMLALTVRGMADGAK